MLTKEELEYLIRRETFTYKNAMVSDAKERSKSIIEKLEKMKEEAEQ